MRKYRRLDIIDSRLSWSMLHDQLPTDIFPCGRSTYSNALATVPEDGGWNT
jgi:hypothetical protein